MGAIIKENTPAISIIIPVYNVEKYLERCLDSVFSQEFTDTFEVIAIDDGSKDNSLIILRNYQKKAPQLKIIVHNKNKRLAKARSTGMEVAKGRYIMHVDSDDWLLPNALEKIYSKCVESDADVVVYNYIIENSNAKRTYLNSIKKELITDDKIKVQKYFFGACWNKIVKNHLVKDMVYRRAEAPFSTEDLIYSTEILLKAKSICLIPENCYVYFKNNVSITSSTKPKKYIHNQIIVSNNLNQICVKYKPSPRFENKLINYFEKWIYFAIFRVHFLKMGNIIECKPVLDELLHSPLFSNYRIKRMKLAFRYNIISFAEVSKRLGLKLIIAIILKNVKQK